jgi:uncharacterized membrane protein YphA (DoxX/SURF4 family)
MLETLSQYGGYAQWFLSFAVGVIFIVHGVPKARRMKPVFGIGGLAQGLVEIVGGALLILNMYARIVALVFALIMLGAIYFKKFKWQTPFSAHAATGWEFDFILLAATLLIATR